MNQKLRGDYGEKLAMAYLESKGYTILERNFRVRGGELDIVARISKTLVFVEVKLRTSDSFGHGDEHIGKIKIARMIRAVERYLGTLNVRDPDYRIDLIEIQSGTITHVQDIEI